VKGEEEEGSVVMRVAVDAKHAAVGVGARMLFYPTLVYNVVMNRFEAHFYWWDQVDEVRQFSSFLFLIDFVPDD
jgi:atypical dual specificity phosphatase